MRTKECVGISRVEICGSERRPELLVVYDGLCGLSKRDLAKDMRVFMERDGVRLFDVIPPGVTAVVWVYFEDYVSYGLGGGDATAENFFGSYLAVGVGPKAPFHGLVDPGVAIYRLRSLPAEVLEWHYVTAEEPLNTTTTSPSEETA